MIYFRISRWYVSIILHRFVSPLDEIIIAVRLSCREIIQNIESIKHTITLFVKYIQPNYINYNDYNKHGFFCFKPLNS